LYITVKIIHCTTARSSLENLRYEHYLGLYQSIINNHQSPLVVSESCKESLGVGVSKSRSIKQQLLALNRIAEQLGQIGGGRTETISMYGRGPATGNVAFRDTVNLFAV